MLNKLILGTVQLGLPYGINNTTGQPTPEQSNALLTTAHSLGIRYLDTAEAYGNAQEVIGNYHQQYDDQRFSVITKCKGVQGKVSGPTFRERFLRNLTILNIPSLEAYLFHSFDEYQSFEHWEVLNDLVAEGRVKKIGVSVYTNEQALKLSADNRIKVVQLPFNLLDNFSLRGHVLVQLQQNEKEVHIRSVFLQGLFYKDRNNLGRLASLKDNLVQLDSIAKNSNVRIGALALAYCLRQPLINKVLIGVETEAQLRENLYLVSASGNIDDAVLKTIDKVQIASPQLLNPSNW